MKRPAYVPKDATWSKSDNEWISSPRDGRDRFHGLVRYYRPDGMLACETEHDRGVPHGVFRRYHQTGEVSRQGRFERGALVGEDVSFRASGATTEQCFPESQAAENVVRYVQIWKDGLLTSRCFYDTEANQVHPWGAALPERPGSVPPEAYTEGEGWLHGAVTGAGKKTGPWILFDKEGTFIEEVGYEDGAARHRLRAISDHEDPEVSFESGPCLGEHWSGEMTLMDGERRPLRTVDPTGARDVEDEALLEIIRGVSEVQWTDMECAYGSRQMVGRYLITLAANHDESARVHALEQLYGHLCHQGSTYDASAAAIPFLVAFAGLEQDDDWCCLMLQLVQDMSVVSRPAFVEGQEEGYDDILQCTAALREAAPGLIGLLDHGSPDRIMGSIRCLAGAFDDRDAIDSLCEQMSAGDPAVRAASLAALGNLDALTDGHTRAALNDPAHLVRLAAAYALALKGETEVSSNVTDIVVEAISLKEELWDDFLALPLVDDDYISEMSNLLTLFGIEVQRPVVIDALLQALGRHRGLGATALVQAALSFVYPEEDEDAELNHEQRQIIKAIGDKDDLWLDESGEAVRIVNLVEVLKMFYLPDSREGLLAELEVEAR